MVKFLTVWADHPLFSLRDLDGDTIGIYFLSFCSSKFLFTPIPCTQTSLALDGMARNYYFYLHGYMRARTLSCLD